jgi:hypothetical protein
VSSEPADEVALELGPTINELARVAIEAGEATAKPRTIRHWVSKGYVSRPRQQGRAWRYPLAAIGQVDTVARLRARDVHPDFFSFALFVETGTGDPENARAFVLEYLVLWKAGIEEQRERFAAHPEELREEAASAARKRGKNAPLPHRVRMTLDERTVAMLHTLAAVASVPLAAEEHEAGQHQLERLVGLRSGRGGATRDVSDVSVTPDKWPTDPDRLLRAVEDATPGRLELARRMVELSVVWFPALRSMFGDVLGAGASVALVDVIEEWEHMITPDMYALLFGFGLLNGEQATEQQIQTTLHALRPEALAAVMLSEQSEHERAASVGRLRPYQRLRLHHFVAAATRRSDPPSQKAAKTGKGVSG